MLGPGGRVALDGLFEARLEGALISVPSRLRQHSQKTTITTSAAASATASRMAATINSSTVGVRPGEGLDFREPFQSFGRSPKRPRLSPRIGGSVAVPTGPDLSSGPTSYVSWT
jgi:hypothetical protein